MPKCLLKSLSTPSRGLKSCLGLMRLASQPVRATTSLPKKINNLCLKLHPDTRDHARLRSAARWRGYTDLPISSIEDNIDTPDPNLRIDAYICRCKTRRLLLLNIGSLCRKRYFWLFNNISYLLHLEHLKLSFLTPHSKLEIN